MGIKLDYSSQHFAVFGRKASRGDPNPCYFQFENLMKKLFLFALLAVGASVTGVSAQEEVKIDGKMKVDAVDTPLFSASNVPDRTWRPKSWLLLDIELQARLSNAAGGRNASLDSMSVTYYVAFNQKNAEGKTKYLKGTLNYVDIPSHEKTHALAFVAPATLKRILQKDNFTVTSDVQGFGFEMSVNGQLVSGFSSTGSKWWESPGVAQESGDILPKKETLFSILWGDYDVAVKK